MKTLILVLALVVSNLADEANDRGTNAAQVATAGLTAARNSQQTGFNSVPYLTPASYMSQSFGVIGGILRYYHDVKMQQEFKAALTQLNMRFDQLEDDMNHRFDQIAGLIDRKQFESDITDPTTILWGELQAYAQYPNNMTFGNMQFECMRQTAWQLAMKIRNRLYGPDNTLMTQIQSDQYSNSSFMATKDVIMFRMFQLMMVQSFCIGVQHGPNYNITGDWELSRMYNIYSALVNNIINMRVKQETDYLSAAGPSIFQQCVTGTSTGSYSTYANCINSKLRSNFPWDHFGVILGESSCVNDHIGFNEAVSYRGLDGAGQGSQPYSVWQHSNGNVVVFVIRYWAPNDSGSMYSQYTGCMKDAYDTNPVKWANYMSCGQSFDILSDDWYCGKYTVYYGSSSGYFVNGAQYTKSLQSTGTSSAVWPYPQRPTTVAYDLGFWERPVPISLIPIPN